jgi:phosphopantothenoylcysteine decarboxylase/phosphopantothenate--cysteine ligase
MHPADELRGSKSNILLNKKIVLGITGSIAAVECVKLARELIRHGAKVFPVMTNSATKIIHPDAIWFATGIKPIVELTGATEHVSFCGRVKDPADLLLICPSTANTVSKIRHGIDDTSVTTFATTALGSSVPILIVPAMHLSMYDHKVIQKNIEELKKIGIKFIEPKIEKNKAKLPHIDEVVTNVIRETGDKKLNDKNVLIIGGPTSESIDDVRIITNRSSGKTAHLLALNAFYRGANVELFYGKKSTEKPLEFIKTSYFDSINDLSKLIKKKNLKKFDVIIICAAISDYIPKKQKGKIPSGKDKIIVELTPASKLLPIIRKKAPKAKIIAFKVEDKKENVKKKSLELLNKNKIDLVVGNTISGFEKDENEIWTIDKKGKITHKKDNKEKLTNHILNSIK